MRLKSHGMYYLLFFLFCRTKRKTFWVASTTKEAQKCYVLNVISSSLAVCVMIQLARILLIDIKWNIWRACIVFEFKSY